MAEKDLTKPQGLTDNPNVRRDAQGNPITMLGNLGENDRHATMDIPVDEQGNELKADPSKSLPENVPGKFFCDSKCISCDVCGEVSPNNFCRVQDPAAQSYVYRQPRDSSEEKLCREAIHLCPVHAIGERTQ